MKEIDREKLRCRPSAGGGAVELELWFVIVVMAPMKFGRRVEDLATEKSGAGHGGIRASTGTGRRPESRKGATWWTWRRSFPSALR